MNAKGIHEAQYFVIDTSIPDTRGSEAADTRATKWREAHLWCASERDSSGTTRKREARRG